MKTVTRIGGPSVFENEITHAVKRLLHAIEHVAPGELVDAARDLEALRSPRDTQLVDAIQAAIRRQAGIHEWGPRIAGGSPRVGTTQFCSCGLGRQWNGSKWLVADLATPGASFEFEDAPERRCG